MLSEEEIVKAIGETLYFFPLAFPNVPLPRNIIILDQDDDGRVVIATRVDE